MSSVNCSSLTASKSIGSGSIASNVVLSVVMGLIAITSVLSNALVIASVAKTPNLQKPANLMLCSVAFSDLLTGLVAMPIFVTTRLLFLHIRVSKCVYQRVLFAYIVSVFTCIPGSFVQLCLLSWDRYKAVSNPLRYRAQVSNRKTLKRITVSWLVFIAWITILTSSVPRPLRDHLLTVMGVLFLVFPAAVQVAIFKSVHLHNQGIIAANAQATAAIALAREKKILTTLRYVLAALIVGLLVPMVVYLATLDPAKPVEHAEEDVTAWSNIFMFMNSCVNPVIYFLRHPDMRIAALRLIGR